MSACRFEQGDVLHAEPAGYEDWSGGAPGPWLQVLDPPRSARALGGGADASRFETQWGSPVELELCDAGTAPPRRLTTTQGRLFTCLWRGDPERLESERAPEPPLLLAELQRRLEAALPALRAALGSGKTGGRRGGEPAQAMLFASGIDRASDASLAKGEAIESALAARFALRVHEAAPGALGVADADRFHPPLRVRGLRIDGADEAAVTEALKAVLYTPGARARSADDPEADDAQPARADRFSVARHGLLAPLVEPPPEQP